MTPLTSGEQCLAIARVSALCEISGGQLVQALARFGYVIASDKPAPGVRLVPRYVERDYTPCDVDPAPETAA